jgi:hypothetical protein
MTGVMNSCYAWVWCNTAAGAMVLLLLLLLLLLDKHLPGQLPLLSLMPWHLIGHASAMQQPQQQQQQQHRTAAAAAQNSSSSSTQTVPGVDAAALAGVLRD